MYNFAVFLTHWTGWLTGWWLVAENISQEQDLLSSEGLARLLVGTDPAGLRTVFVLFVNTKGRYLAHNIHIHIIKIIVFKSYRLI